jgi:cyclase
MPDVNGYGIVALAVIFVFPDNMEQLFRTEYPAFCFTQRLQNPKLITEIADRVGSQSVIVVLDVKKKLFGGYEVYTHNGKSATGINPFQFIEQAQKLGAGEIVINSIDQDGVMKGFDMSLVDKAREKSSLPMTFLGGAGSLEDIKKVIDKHKIIGVAAGSLFVFKGKYKAVLINYPNKSEKVLLFK